MANNYTDEELIKHYKNFGQELGKAPSQSDVNKRRLTDKSFPSSPALARRFGFTKLAEICGFNLNRKVISKEDLLKILEDYFHKYGIPTQDDFDNNPELPSSAVYQIHFGGIRNALIFLNLINRQNTYEEYAKMTDGEIIFIIEQYCIKNGNIKSKDFRIENGLPTKRFIGERFGSMKVVYDLCNISYDDYSFSQFKNMSDKELIDKLIWFSANVGFPTNRALNKHSEMPHSNTYYERFGSLRIALNISGIEIPRERESDFDRISLSNEELLRLVKYHTESRLSDGGIFLMSMEDLDKIDGVPRNSTYYSRFGNIENIYNLIGYDYKEFNEKALKKDMKEKYLEIHSLLGKVPSSRDIEYYSRNLNDYYSMSSYEFHFGCLYNLQIECELNPTGVGRNKTRQNLLDDLLWLQSELGRTPLMQDLLNFDNIASSRKYCNEFGGYSEALKEAGINPNTNIYVTKKGTKCLSYYELRISNWLEDNDVEYKKEIMYNKVLKDDKTLRRFDWIISRNNNTYYIEMFGVVGIADYLIKTKNKINDCKLSGIDLIALYPEDLKRPLDELFSFLFEDKQKAV